MCEVCNDTGKVPAKEIPGRGWTCEGINGEAKCNRPEYVHNEFDDEFMQVLRKGDADCPVCTRRKIEETGTGDFGYPLEDMAWK